MLFAITPLVRTSFTYNSFELPKIFFLKSLILILVGIVLLKIFNGLEFKIIIHKINIWLLLFFIIYFLSAIAAESKSLATGCISFLFYILVFLFILQDFLSKNPLFIFKLSIGIAISAALTSLWVLYEDFAAHFMPEKVHIITKLEDWRGFLSVGFGSTSHIGYYLAIGCFIGFAWMIIFYPKSHKIAFLILISIIFPGLIVC